MHVCCFDDVKYQQTRIVKVVQTSLTYEMYEPLLLQIVACDRVLRYECFFAHGKIWGLWAIGLATSCRWIPKKFLIKVSKSCQKVAEKLLNFQKVAENLPKFFCFSYLFWALKIKNSHMASYQNFVCQSPMIISEVLSISFDQQIVYQNDMNKTWLYTHIMSRTVFMWRVALHSFSMKSIHVWLSLMTSSHQTTTSLFLWFWL